MTTMTTMLPFSGFYHSVHSSVEGDIAYCDEYYLIVDQWCIMFPELDKVLTEARHSREERERQG